mgnify:FL=1
MGEFVVSLHPGQAAIYNSPARFKICAAGRRFGKSHFAAYMLGIAALKEEHRGYALNEEAGVYYVAPTFDQGKRIMWPKLKTLLGYEKEGGLIRGVNSNEGWLQLINDRKIYVKGADNPDSLRGIGLSYVVLDEYADMRANVWTEILDPALMDYEGDALFIGTPKGKNHFYTMFMRGMEYHFEDTDDPYPMYESFHFRSLDNPFLAEHELNRLMDSDNSSRETVRQEIEADFVSGGGNVLKPSWFEVVDKLDLEGRDGNGNHVVHGGYQGSFYVTVDLAGFVKERNKVVRTDETVICTTYVTEDAWYVLDMQHGHWDAREVALRIIRTVDQTPNCRLGIEKGALMNAIGDYLEDEMRRFNRYVTPEALSHGNTRKIDRIVNALQGRAQRGRVKLLSDTSVMSKASRRGEPWNEWFLDQVADFPDQLAHDDGPDALAYVDQMQSVGYYRDHDIEEWEAMDLDSGY